MSIAKSCKHWIGTRGHELITYHGIKPLGRFQTACGKVYWKVLSLLECSRERDEQCKENLRDVAGDFLESISDGETLQGLSLPSFLYWGLHNLRNSLVKEGFRYERCCCPDLNRFLSFKHGMDLLDTAGMKTGEWPAEYKLLERVIETDSALHSEISVYGHTDRKNGPYAVHLDMRKGWRDGFFTEFLLNPKYIDRGEDILGFPFDMDFPYQRYKFLGVSEDRSFTTGCVFYHRGKVMQQKQQWKFLGGIKRNAEKLFVYLKHISRIGHNGT